MRKFRDLAIVLFFSLGLTIVIVGSLFNYFLSPVSNDENEIKFEIKDGNDINSIVANLYEEKLIRNPKVFKFYLNVYKIDHMREGSFKISKNMSSREIAHFLSIDKK
jgi:cell division protein YceG involved in septum cleavage